MNETTKAVLKDILYDIFEEIDEVSAQKKDSYDSGQLLAYATVLGRIKMRVDADEWKNFGIDFDIDEKYLQA